MSGSPVDPVGRGGVEKSLRLSRAVANIGADDEVLITIGAFFAHPWCRAHEYSANGADQHQSDLGDYVINCNVEQRYR